MAGAQSIDEGSGSRNREKRAQNCDEKGKTEPVREKNLKKNLTEFL